MSVKKMSPPIYISILFIFLDFQLMSILFWLWFTKLFTCRWHLFLDSLNMANINNRQVNNNKKTS